MSISYYTSNNNRPEIDEITSNKRMEDLLDKDKKSKMTGFINAVLPLNQKSIGHDEDNDALKLKGT